MNKHISYNTSGTCSRRIEIDIENGIVTKVKFEGGCSGNTQGVSALCVGMTPDEIDNAMNKKSGLLGVSGVSNDGREVWAAADAGNERAKLAMDLMARGAIKLIGTYTAEMNGLDVLVFTAGVGENDRRIREMVAGNLSFFGIKFDAEKNATAPHGSILEISCPDSATKVLVIPTDEEYMIACDTGALAKAL